MPSITLREHTWKDPWDAWRQDRLVLSFLSRPVTKAMDLLYIHHDYKSSNIHTTQPKPTTREEAEKLLSAQCWAGADAPIGIWLTSEMAEEMDGRKKFWWYHEDYYDGEDLRSVKFLWLKVCWNQDMFDRQFWKEVITEKEWPNTRRYRGNKRLAEFFNRFSEDITKACGFGNSFRKLPAQHPFVGMSRVMYHITIASEYKISAETRAHITQFADLADFLIGATSSKDQP